MGLSQHQVITLREQFAARPRDARTASQEARPGSPAQQRPGHEPATQAEWDDPEAEPQPVRGTDDTRDQTAVDARTLEDPALRRGRFDRSDSRATEEMFRVLSTFGGTTEIQKGIIARSLGLKV